MGNRSSTQVDNSFYQRTAYQVVHVVKDSPADKAGLMPYFDFLTYLPPVRTYTNSPLPYDEFVRDALSRQPSLDMMVFNCATGAIRKVNLQPARYGSGPLDLTGFIVRPTIIADAISQVEHVQEVSVGSPAFDVGLVPHFDYIIATDEANCFDIHQIIRAHNPDDCLRIYVVDIFLKASRVMQIPGFVKLGEGKFGCALASGYLHRIPSTKLDFHLVRQKHHQHSPGDERNTVSRANSMEDHKHCDHDHDHHGHDHGHDHGDHDHGHHDHGHHGHGHSNNVQLNTLADKEEHFDHGHQHGGHSHDHHNGSDCASSHQHAKHEHSHEPNHHHRGHSPGRAVLASCGGDHSHSSSTLLTDACTGQQKPRSCSSSGASTCCDADDHHGHGHGQKKKTKKKSKKPAEPVDPNTCTFVTRMQLPPLHGVLAAKTVEAQAPGSTSAPGHESVVRANSANSHNGSAGGQKLVPIQVQIPKDIVQNVVADLVRYQREHEPVPKPAEGAEPVTLEPKTD